MKFACDSCGAQYVIADEKVGPRGVKVRCKKCSHVVVVRPTQPDAAPDAAEPEGPPAAPEAFGGEEVEAEIGAAFDSIFGGEGGAGEDDALVGMGGDEASHGAAGEPDEAEGEEGIEAPAASAFAGSAPEDGGADPQAEAPSAEAAAPAADVFGLGGEDGEAGGDDPFADVDDAFAAALSGEGGAEPSEPRETADPFDTETSPAGPAAAALAREPEPDADEVEWFVAIADRQVGPMDLEALRGRWEAGEITPDSLVWREGLTEWRPLSSVEALKRELAPGPVELEPPPEEDEAAATPSEAASPRDEEDAPDWKPAGASLLASLAAEEMEALDRPADEARSGAATGAATGAAGSEASAEASGSAGQVAGLDLDLPPPPARPSEAEPSTT